MRFNSSNLSLASRIGLSLVLGLLGMASGNAEETNETESAITNAPGLKVDVRANVEGTFMPYRYAFVTAGSAKFTFLVPDGYRVDTSDPARVKLASPDYSCLIVIGAGNGGGAAGSVMTAETLRAHVLAQYPDAVIQGEQAAYANSQAAPALDFTWKADAGITRRARTTFIPTVVGPMEFTLTAGPEQFPAGLAEMNLVLCTFRTGSNGRFDYVIGSKYP